MRSGSRCFSGARPRTCSRFLSFVQRSGGGAAPRSKGSTTWQFAPRRVDASTGSGSPPPKSRVDLDLIDHVDATLVAELETLVAEHPFRERFWEQLILSLYRLGRQTEALAAYKRARRVLIDEIGVEPGPGLRHLEAAILDHDVSLLSAPRQRGRRVVPPALDASGSLFVGRDRDMATLLTWWSSCLSGAGGFVSVMGPDGAGKTRLAAELAGRVHVQNGVVLYARCDHAYVGPRLLFDAALRSQGSSITDVSVGTDGLAVATAQHLAASATRPAGVGRAGRSPPCRRRDPVGGR